MNEPWMAIFIGVCTLTTVLSTVAEWRLNRLRNRRIDLLEKRIGATTSSGADYVISVRVDGLDDVERLSNALTAVAKESGNA